HYSCDLVWFSIPIFLSSSPRARVEQGLVMALGLLPLGVILYQRFKSRAWFETPEMPLNHTWAPPAVEEVAPPPVAPIDDRPDTLGVSSAVSRFLRAAGIR